MTNHFKNYAPIVLFCALMVAFGCKKDKREPEPPDETNVKQTPTTNRVDLTNDSLFLYAKQIYYWNSSLPSYDVFEPRQYKGLSTDLDNYETNLLNIGKASGSADYIANSNYLKYSYIEDITTRNPEPLIVAPNAKASIDLNGNGNDFGIRPVYYLTSNTTNEFFLFITAVYPGSDADAKGVKRGWVITKINGQSIGSDYITQGDLINSALSGDRVTLEGEKYSSKTSVGTFSVELSKTNYKSSPIYLSKVFTAGSKKIGYLNYARFSNESNSVEALNSVFSDFSGQGVTDLIVDLRYNGGGYVSTAEHLVNLIAPSSVTGVMYREYFNRTLQDGKAEIMKNQPIMDADDEIQYQNGRMLNYFADADYSVSGNTHNFSKAGALKNVTNIVFIVTGSTASASELVINCLRPKMNVKLVGDNTYGKPVGFFPIRLENKYDVLMAMFETKNSAGQGGYFTGIVPDYNENNSGSAFFDDPRYDFGDKQEPYLAKAIAILNPQNASVSYKPEAALMTINGRSATLSTSSTMKPMNEGNGEFIGMIETRIKPKSGQ